MINKSEQYILYNHKIWRGITFGGLVVCRYTAKLKTSQYFCARAHARVHIVLNYDIIQRSLRALHHPQIKFANILISPNCWANHQSLISGQTTKFKDCQYFQLYGTSFLNYNHVY